MCNGWNDAWFVRNHLRCVRGDHDAEDAVSRPKDTVSFFPGLRRTQRLPEKGRLTAHLVVTAAKEASQR